MSQGFNYRRFYDRIAPIYAIGMCLIPVWRSYIFPYRAILTLRLG